MHHMSEPGVRELGRERLRDESRFGSIKPSSRAFDFGPFGLEAGNADGQVQKLGQLAGGGVRVRRDVAVEKGE